MKRFLKTIVLSLAMTVLTLGIIVVAGFAVLLMIALVIMAAVRLTHVAIVGIVALALFSVFVYRINDNLSNGRNWYDIN